MRDMASDSLREVNTNPIVWIVTTVFDRFDSLSMYLECIDNQSYENIKIVIVDHGKMNVEDRFSFGDKVVIIKASTDLWWTGAVNAGLNYVVNHSISHRDYVMLQNDDSTFNATFIESLVNAAVKNGKSIIGSIAVNRSTKKIIHCNMVFDLLRAKYIYQHKGGLVDNLSESIYESDVLKGRGVLFPIKVFKKIGLLEEKLPQYKSDHEITHRAKSNGYKLLVTPLAVTETIMDTQQQVSKGKLFKSIKLIFTNRRSTSNISDAVIYYKKCYSFPLSYYLILVHVIKTLIGVVVKVYR
jgi:GT2 family glycosyltransferase